MSTRILPLLLVALLAGCSAPPAGGESPRSERTGDGGCACVQGGDGEGCDCPHCASMNAGFSPGECPCARRAKKR
ncbi:hypothetical protein HY251_03825 [bacterium]|nr:hypothetical protein [bacterium]